MQSWGYLVGISRQFRTISTIFDNPLPSSLFDSKPSSFCSCYGTYRGSGTLHFTVLFPITNLSLLRFPFTPSVLIRFPPLLRTISTIPDTPLPPSYSIPSPVVSVVAIAVIGLWHTSIYGSLFRFPISEPLLLPSPRPVIPALRL
jgi:hypothetical protein